MRQGKAKEATGLFELAFTLISTAASPVILDAAK
jgi:hypothetical protein